MKICPICHGKYDVETKCPKCNIMLFDPNNNLKQHSTRTTRRFTEERKREVSPSFNKVVDKVNNLKNTYAEVRRPSQEETYAEVRRQKADETQDEVRHPRNDETLVDVPSKEEEEYEAQWKPIGHSRTEDRTCPPNNNAKDVSYNRNKEEDGHKNGKSSSVSIPIPALIGGGVLIIVLMVGVVFAMSKKDNKVAQGDTDNPVVEDQMNDHQSDDITDIEEATTEEEYEATEMTTEAYVEEENEMTLPYTDNTYMNVDACLSEADFASVYSEDQSFHFCYPKYLFNNFTYNEETQEYYFSYNNNGQAVCSLEVHKEYNPNGNPVEAAKNLRYRFENRFYKSNYYWPTKDLSKLTTDQNSTYKEPRGDGLSRYIMSGWTTSNQSTLLYCLGANDGVYDYILEFRYPEYDINDDMEDWDYVVECIYRSCSFSGTNYAVRDYNTFMREGYGEGHH